MRTAIIGCSAAGGWLAGQLALRGEDVTIIERKDQPGGKACSGLVSERIWGLVPKNEELVENVIEDVAIHFPGKTVTASFRPRMLALSRPGLDNYLAKLAVEAGAELRLGSTFEGLREVAGRVMVRTERGEETFDRVVGCDGARSRVRSTYSRNEPRYRAGIQCFEPKKDGSNTAEAWPTKDGFFWRIPRGHHVEWGVFEEQARSGAMWRKFAGDHGIGTLPVQGALVPEGVMTTGSASVALCGDAAGLTKPWSGGGILWGITSAKMLLDSWPNVGTYEARMRRHFSRKIAVGRLGTRAVTFMGARLPRLVPSRVSFDSDWLI